MVIKILGPALLAAGAAKKRNVSEITTWRCIIKVNIIVPILNYFYVVG
jgi:hypothetical protein